MSEIYYCYSINPTDFWFGSFCKKQLLQHALNSMSDLDGCIDADFGEDAQTTVTHLVTEMTRLDEVMDAFAKLLIDSDWREEARYCFLPSEYALQMAVMRKVDNNGTTYVVSPVPLDYLLGQHNDYAYMDENGLWHKEP
jgi:hypothetical protein